MSSYPSALIQCFAPSVSIIVRYPGGISGGSWPIVRLHTGHGIPAPPRWQASSRSLAPSHGLSGWSSHTQRAPPQTSHSEVSISPHPLFVLIPQALEFQGARAHGRRCEADGLRRARTWRNGREAHHRHSSNSSSSSSSSCDRTHKTAGWRHNVAASSSPNTTTLAESGPRQFLKLKA